METIILVGGPFDGKSLAWNGGDVVQLAKARPALPLGSYWTNPEAEKPAFDDAFYRRSMISANMFVWQP